MMSSRKIELAPRARADLRSLFSYSLATWGEPQAVAYLQRLANAMHELIAYPRLGRARDDLAAGLRALSASHHVIFYLMDDRKITIVRILHVKMDPSKHIVRSG